MAWFDERFFGWSRNAKRGTSAWSGFSGDESSRLGTPDETDEEDIGDYDNVVGIVASTEDTQLQSHRSSYADLQRLRHTSMPPVIGKNQWVPSKWLRRVFTATGKDEQRNSLIIDVRLT